MKKKHIIFLLTIFSGLTISGCNITNGYKNAKIENVVKNTKISSTLRSYEQCIADGKSFDILAANNKDQAESLYNKSAKILTDCDHLISNNSYLINEEERMQNFALSIQNYLKAGNLINGSLNFKSFKSTFHKDLIYQNGSSFTENIESLLSHNDNKTSLEFTLLNNSKIIKSELKRIKYWSKN
tara:strand:+ start:736 stop:1287 length:552 start_codon:yes stop_codon:yes gene_type:complete